MVDVGIDATLNSGSGTSFAGKYQVYVNLENPCDVARNITEVKARIVLNSGASDITVQFRSYKIDGTSLALTSSTSWMATTTIGDIVRTYVTSFTVGADELIACAIHDPHADFVGADANLTAANSSYSYDPTVLVGGETDSFSVISNYTSHTSGNPNGSLCGGTGDITGSGSGIGGDPRNACHNETGTWEVNDVVDDTWGYMKVTQFSTEASSPQKVWCDVTYPWDTSGELQFDEIFSEGITKTFDNPLDDSEHWSITADVIDYVDSTGILTEYTECWWKEEPNGNVYVDVHTGNDSNFGISWDSAYETVTKGMAEVSTDAIVNIRTGSYPSETSPAPNRSCVVKLSHVYEIVYDGVDNGSFSTFLDRTSGTTAHMSSVNGEVVEFTYRGSGNFLVRADVYRIDGSTAYHVTNSSWYEHDTVGITEVTLNLASEHIGITSGQIVLMSTDPISSAVLGRDTYTFAPTGSQVFMNGGTFGQDLPIQLPTSSISTNAYRAKIIDTDDDEVVISI